MNTTHNITDKNTPWLEHNIINSPQKVRTPVSKIPLLITKDTTRNDLDQAAKKSTIEQGEDLVPWQKDKKGDEIVP